MSPAVQTGPAINNYSQQLRELLDEHLPKEGEVLIFKQLFTEQKKEALNENDVQVQFMTGPRGLRLKRLESIIDPGTGRPITIGNHNGGYQASTNGTSQPIIEEILFSSSGNNILYVDENSPLLAERLLLSNKNRDCINPRRTEPETGYGFEQVKPATTAESEYETLKKRYAAMSALTSIEGDHEAILRMVGKLSIPTVEQGRKLTDKELLVKLGTVAQNDPERVSNLTESEENKLEELVAKAIKFGLLDFVEEAQQWRWKSSQEPITEAVQGFRPEEALIKYIQANPNGIKFSQMLAARVKQEEKKAK